MKQWNEILDENVKKVLFDESAIQTRVAELAKQITEDYSRMGADKLLVVGILRGSVLFFSDLVRQLQIPVELDFMSVSSYGNGTVSSGQLQIGKDISKSIAGRHVLLVEDLVDTGFTLQNVRRMLQERTPADLSICTLMDKPSRRIYPVQVEYNGFTIPDEFVVGYGLDFDDDYRHLPYIAVLKPEAYKK